MTKLDLLRFLQTLLGSISRKPRQFIVHLVKALFRLYLECRFGIAARVSSLLRDSNAPPFTIAGSTIPEDCNTRSISHVNFVHSAPIDSGQGDSISMELSTSATSSAGPHLELPTHSPPMAEFRVSIQNPIRRPSFSDKPITNRVLQPFGATEVNRYNPQNLMFVVFVFFNITPMLKR